MKTKQLIAEKENTKMNKLVFSIFAIGLILITVMCILTDNLKAFDF